MVQNKPNYNHIFLLSHMRANSSLISHILGSHPQISGYYEMHQSYLNEQDLSLQKERYAIKDNIKEGNLYLFDKLLHNKYQLLLENLDAKKIKVLISIRSPEQSIKSIVSLFRKKNCQHPYAQPKLATEYYSNRIAQLAKYCAYYKYCYYYYDAELIRSEPQKCLQKIQSWLSLDGPLHEQYQIFSQTGLAGAGDSSENMKKGTIIKKVSNYESIEIPASLLDKIISETRQYRESIISYAKEGYYQ